MAYARAFHTATLLSSGQLLVAGGQSSSGYLATAELYNPAAGAWTTTGSMAYTRMGHTAALLSNGQVLIAGGVNSATAELYNPATGTWTNTGSMAYERSWHTATLLSDGQVLVTGGVYSVSGTGVFPATAELYNPATGTWTTTGSMAQARDGHTATLLTSGEVLVAGGYVANVDLAAAELYNPTMGTWTTTGSMAYGRNSPMATLLASGQVLVEGGYGPNGTGWSSLAVAELYNPTTGVWTTTGSMAHARYDHTATLLASGQVLVAGGVVSANNPIATAEVYGQCPIVTTGTATGTVYNGSTLNRTVNPNGLSATSFFQYGTTSSYGSTTGTQASGNGTSAVPVNAAITGLNPSTTYHFQTVAINSSGTTSGLDQTFTTPNTPIVLWQQSVFGINASNPAISGDKVVNNVAGISNLMTYALGTNPYTAAVNCLPLLGTVSVSGTAYFVLGFSRNTMATDITYIVEANSDLTNPTGWTAISTFNANAWTPAGNITESGSGASVEVEVQDTVPIQSAPRRFLRLEIIH